MESSKRRLGRRVRRDGEYWLYDWKETLLYHSTPYYNGILECFFGFLNC